jgi:uncharacterized protein (TIGR00369 family)
MKNTDRPDGYGPMTPVAEGEWAGWSQWGADPFEAMTGPYYCRYDTDGRARTALRAQDRHMNGGGFMHGGALMTFADYTLFFVARATLDDAPAVTATCNCEFVGAVTAGDLVEGTGEVVKAGRSMIFVRGTLSVGGEPVVTFSAVVKRSGARP